LEAAAFNKWGAGELQRGERGWWYSGGMAKKVLGGWGEVGRALGKAPRGALTKLLKELYEGHEGVRDFLHARYAPVAGPDAGVLAAYRERVRALFPEGEMYPQPVFAEVRAIAKEYDKAAVDPVGASGLMVEGVELGLRAVAVAEVGGRYVEGLGAMMRALDKRLRTGEGREAARELEDRIRGLTRWSGKCGYGLSDSVQEWVEEVLRDLPERRKRYDGDADFDEV